LAGAKYANAGVGNGMNLTDFYTPVIRRLLLGFLLFLDMASFLPYKIHILAL
jgi:hypothetical protein